MASYPDTVRYLYSIGNEMKAAKFGLERIRTLLSALGDPQNAYPTVHVAGTNGKGSTCAMIASGLRTVGRRTGLYTSPHLVEPTERIQIDGEPVATEEFAAAFREVHQTAEQLISEGRIDMHPSYFEIVTAMGFLLFWQREVEIAVIEVGLGGRLDATNVLKPILTVITPIDFDHQAMLGDTIRQISTEKAGIIKSDTPVVVSVQSPEALEVLRETAAVRNAPWRGTDEWPVQQLVADGNGSRFTLSGPVSISVECPLPGEHQVANAVTAAVALHELGLSPQEIRQGIVTTRWPGRLELLRRNPDVILDGAHNQAGTQALVDYIRHFQTDRRIWLVYGVMRDKDVREMTRDLFPLAHAVVATAPAMARSLPPEELAAQVSHPRLETAPNLAAAWQKVRQQAAPEDLILITGSLYLVGEAEALLTAE